MSDKRKTRIKLLEDVRGIIENSYEIDRDLYTYSVRKENRKLKKILKEIEEWTEDLKNVQRVDEIQRRLRIQRIQEANAK